MKERKNVKLKSVICWCAAWIFGLAWAAITILPFVFMVMTSLKERFEVLMKGIFAPPKELYLDNYIAVFKGNILNYFKNSVFVLTVSLILLLFISACAAYPLARFRFRAAKSVFSLIVACMSIPIHITLIPIFKISNKVGVYDSVFALIGPYVAIAIPISVFILTGFMREIPIEIEEAARIDGCNRYMMFGRIMLPLSKPGLATLAIYNGVSMWNEFVFAYTLTRSPKNRTLPLAVWEFQGEFAMNTPMIMAVLTITVIPMVILYIFMQERLVKGMTAGAVKG